MKLFYLQPSGHGSTSYFVTADSAEQAAAAINAQRAQWAMTVGCGYYSDGWGGQDAVIASALKQAGAGEVLCNDND